MGGLASSCLLPVRCCHQCCRRCHRQTLPSARGQRWKGAAARQAGRQLTWTTERQCICMQAQSRESEAHNSVSAHLQPAWLPEMARRPADARRRRHRRPPPARCTAAAAEVRRSAMQCRSRASVRRPQARHRRGWGLQKARAGCLNAWQRSRAGAQGDRLQSRAGEGGRQSCRPAAGRDLVAEAARGGRHPVPAFLPL